MNKLIIEADIDKISSEIYLYLCSNFIDTKPTRNKLYFLSRGYVEAWQKNPNVGLKDWLNTHELDDKDIDCSTCTI